jgi:2'-5' RNA ligase
MSNKRLFFALWPDHRQRDRLRDFITPVAKLIEGRAVDRRNWHVTLAFIGEFAERRMPELRERASGIHVEPFRLTFDRLEFWARPRVASLSAATVPPELQHLVESLTLVLADLGVATEDRTYRPHITVARNARPFETQRLAQRATTEWSSFELLESDRGPGGVSYQVVDQ